ncbi:hypothetical protein INR49_007165 [Caranx melampygus]|nr:hypothetical protein INR49_007165 [Caranx melampygus]
MSSVESLRDFVTERLTAAAEEIFRVFKQTVVEYEEEIGRQRRLLDTVLKPEIRLHRTELPRQHVCKTTDVLSEQQLCELQQQQVRKKEEVLCEQQRNSSLEQEEPEPPQIKEEEEEVCSSQEGEQLLLKQETDSLMLTPTHEESEHREPEPTSEQQLLSHSSPVADNQHQEGSGRVDPEPPGNVETQPQKRRRTNTRASQQHACQEEKEEEEALSSLEQEPEPPQIKEEEEEVCSSQEGEQLLLKQETDSLMLTPTHEGSEHREPEPTSEQQLLSHSSPVAENQHQEGSGHVDPEPPGNVETQPQKRRRTNTNFDPSKLKGGQQLTFPTGASECDTQRKYTKTAC